MNKNAICIHALHETNQEVMYIYIYMCVCVCVSQTLFRRAYNKNEFFLISEFIVECNFSKKGGAGRPFISNCNFFSSRGHGSLTPSHANEAMEFRPEENVDAHSCTCIGETVEQAVTLHCFPAFFQITRYHNCL